MSSNNSTHPLNMLKGLGLVTILSLAMACGGGDTSTEGTSTPAPAPGGAPAAPAADLITADEVHLGDIDPGMVAKGKEIYDVKCQACHSIGTNRVVGPGWKNMLDQRKPEWIMNMIVHTDAMLETDPEAQAMLEECLVRMPNQNLSVADARNVLEFIRSL